MNFRKFPKENNDFQTEKCDTTTGQFIKVFFCFLDVSRNLAVGDEISEQ